MRFVDLADFFSKLEKTSSRISKINLLSEVILKGKADIDKIIYLSEGRVVPFFVNLEFNIGNSLVQKAIAQSLSIEVSKVSSKYDELGDLGDVVNSLSKSETNDGVSVSYVFDTLTSLVNTKGKDSTTKKIEILSDLLKRVDRESARYVVRIVLGKLRLGFSDKTILDALSVSLTKDKSQRSVIEKAYYRCSDLGYISKILAKDGIKGIEHISLIPSVPVFPKLVERSSGVDEIFKRIPTPIFQPKYDGLRGQIHIFKDSEGKKAVKIFSRRLEDMTEMFPDIIKASLSLPLDSAILDSEIIGFNIETNEFFPFQETMQRKRKYGIDDLSLKIPVISFAFDILYLNEKDLTDDTLNERLSILSKLLANSKQDVIKKSESLKMENKEDANKYFLKCVEEGLEGIIAKDENTIYSPGTRNFEWIKLKRASVGELNDTIDCVILGYYYGYGQRSKFGIGALLVGVYNKEEDRFETIAKIGTGIKDDQFIELKKTLDNIKIKEPASNVLIDKNLIPDISVDPKLVVEIRADEITKSSIHTAGKSKNGLGYALRFPRLVNIREDKRPDDIANINDIEEMIKSAKRKQ